MLTSRERELKSQYKKSYKNISYDKLESPITELSRFYKNRSGDLITAYRILPDTYTQEDLDSYRDKVSINKPESETDRTREFFTSEWRFTPCPIGWVVIHKMALDI